MDQAFVVAAYLILYSAIAWASERWSVMTMLGGLLLILAAAEALALLRH